MTCKVKIDESRAWSALEHQPTDICGALEGWNLRHVLSFDGLAERKMLVGFVRSFPVQRELISGVPQGSTAT